MIKGVTTNQKPTVNNPAGKGEKNTTILLSNKFLDMLREKGGKDKE